MLKRSSVIKASILSCLLALSLSLSMNISYTGNVSDLYPLNFMSRLTLINLAVFVILFMVILLAFLTVLRSIKEKKTEYHEADLARSVNERTLVGYIKDKRLVLIIGILITLIAWCVIFANYLPGTSMNDQLAIIGHPLAYSNNHPILYNLVLSGLVQTSRHLFGSGEYGFACYVLIQMIFSVLVIAFCVAWMKWRGVSEAICFVVWTYFVVCPVVINYSFCTIKDTLFAYILVLWIPFIWEYVIKDASDRSRISTLVIYIVLSIMTALIRNNGIYVSVFVGLILAARYFKNGGAKIIPALLVVVIVSAVPNAILSGLGVHQLFREAVGIPIQQIASVVAARPDSVSEDDQAYLNTLLSDKTFGEAYAPMSADMIKYDPSFNTEALEQSKGHFIKMYLRLGASNPDLYFYSLLSQTWGYWSAVSANGVQSWFFSVSDNYQSELDKAAIEEFGINNKSLYPDSISHLLDEGFAVALSAFPGCGFLFFGLLVFSLVIDAKVGKGVFVVCAPYIGLWLTILIATPVSCALRYGFPFVVAFPIMFGLMFSAQVQTASLSRQSNG